MPGMPQVTTKVVVIDDDPTGSQTVHSCPLLLRWDRETLRQGLRHPSPLLFVLANTRALAPGEAAARNREIMDALAAAMAAEGLSPDHVQLVSRGDSTLRGHGVLEPEVLATAWQACFGRPVDATLHVPAFLPGGRTTVDGVHLLHGVPVHTTAFARDRLFGYSTSDLAAWLAEKSGGAIAQTSVLPLGWAVLDRAAESRSGADPAGFNALLQWLEGLQGNPPVVVDATRPEQLEALGAALHQLQGRKRFVFRSAASLLNGLVDGGLSPLGPQPLDGKGLAGLRRHHAGTRQPGLVLVGSHVPLADQQLQQLLRQPQCHGVELPVARIARVLDAGPRDWLLPDLEAEWRMQLEKVLSRGCTPVLFTSRGELGFGEGDGAVIRRLRFGMELARLMGRLVAALVPQLGYVISKGGITTGTLLADGLALDAVQLEGQLLPGLSLVRPLSPSSPAVDGLPIVTFPGNLGDADTLLQTWRLMEGLP
ncbi:MAG: four-carbon acid sugar kinase family protein [Synechococcus sp.]